MANHRSAAIRSKMGRYLVHRALAMRSSHNKGQAALAAEGLRGPPTSFVHAHAMARKHSAPGVKKQLGLTIFVDVSKTHRLCVIDTSATRNPSRHINRDQESQ